MLDDMGPKPEAGGLAPQIARPTTLRFVLVEPQSAGNVGAAARALKNLGLSRLYLVRPQCDPRGRQARTMAREAEDLLEEAWIGDDLDRALGGVLSVIGSSRRTGKYRRPHHRLDLFADELAALTAAGELALVFGREDRGLTDDELDRCTHLVYLPAAADFPSFNLAQAVLLVAYEVCRAFPAARPLEEPPADHAAREALYEHLERALLAIGFLRGEGVVATMRRLRRLFGKAALTADEVRLLHGVAHQALWAAGGAAGGHSAAECPTSADCPPSADDPRGA